MRRERAELMRQMDELESIWDAENEMGYGMFYNEVAAVFEPQMSRLTERLAATYGMTAAEYEQKQQERMYEDSQREWARLTARTAEIPFI